MELVEREGLLAELSRFLDEARGGEGRLALVGGEAGAGKTSLVRTFAGGLPGGVRLLQGACDPLSTPRPLAPFRDMAVADDSVARLVAGRPARHDVLARRVHGTRGLVLVTYRDDELPAEDGVRAVLGDLATATGCRRLTVQPLTL